MNGKNENLKNEVWNHFKDVQSIFLATCDGKKARVRPVTLIYFNDKFWIATGANDAKIKQLKDNNNIEFCLMLEENESRGYIRGAGAANIVQDNGTKKLLADNIPFFKDVWKDSEDPDFALLEIAIQEIEYMKPGKFEAERFSL
ncbi:MAG: hypothetical protein E3J87_08925 [Candidatus Cloacimonadota bacterium]|nr:MAG: hypothetical protein E3J87_08925 [Candidatus Cloacimonadota bacterium]